jgi:hypothetical protein
VAVITGEIVDMHGNYIAVAHAMLTAAIGDCEGLMQILNIQVSES